MAFQITITSGLKNATELVIGTSSTGTGYRTLMGQISNIEGAGPFAKQLNDKLFSVKGLFTLTEAVALEIEEAFSNREDSAPLAPFVGITFEVNSINLTPGQNDGDDICLWSPTSCRFVGITGGFNFLSMTRALGLPVPARRQIPDSLQAGVIAREPDMEAPIETALVELAAAAEAISPKVRKSRKADQVEA